MDDTPFSLIANLAKKQDVGTEQSDNRADFVTAMGTLGYTSVFDIVRRAKPAFIQDVARLSNADGGRAYDNAMCYAIQIVRAYREQQISSGKKQTLTQRGGIRSLVDVGPSFPNLFKENWDTFCKVGAIEAMDSPVAYLASLYRFTTQQLEGSPSDNKRISLDARRPDLKDLLIDQHSTFTPVPMLEIVTTVLEKSIRGYVDTEGHPDNGRTTYELVASKRHPFLFPYNYQHHQVILGLAGKKPALGELYYRISQALPISGIASNEYGASRLTRGVAQCWLSGLSPEQQTLLTEKTLFSTYYVSKNSLTGPAANGWQSGGSLALIPWQDITLGYLAVPGDGANVAPEATALKSTGTGNSTLNVEANDTVPVLSYRLYGYQTGASLHVNTSQKPNPLLEKTLGLYYTPDDNENAELPTGEPVNTHFSMVAATEAAADGVDESLRSLYEIKITLSLDNTLPNAYQLTAQQMDFFKKSYDVTVPYDDLNSLTSVKSFLQKTGLNTEQLEALLSQKSQAPTCSPNCRPLNPLFAEKVLKFPQPLHYGACYVNGVGGRDPGTLQFDVNDNAIGLTSLTDGNNVASWHLTNTSLYRFDRLQRMIRLQRWMDIPFADLDTLIMAAIHSEREDNLGWELNTNTLRALGVYRYLSKRYSVGVEEFAAFMHYLTPFAVGTRKPLLDKVFNSPQLFDTPLTIDGIAFAIDEPDAASQKTILQLCAGLGLQPTENSFGLLAKDTAAFIGPANADGTSKPAALKRLLPIVSSFYRQARIAKMFGLSVEESRGLIHLLGGDTYLKQVVTGRLSKHTGIAEEDAGATPDILDILMQIDWAVGWQKETKWNVETLQTLVNFDGNDRLSLRRSLLSLKDEILNETLNTKTLQPTHYAVLNLPLLRYNASDVRWYDFFKENYTPRFLFVQSVDNLTDGLKTHIKRPGTTLDRWPVNNYKYLDNVANKLSELFLKQYEIQQNYIADLLSTLQAPRQSLNLYLLWAGTTSEDLLYDAMFSYDDFIEKLTRVYRCAKLTEKLKISHEGLLTFLSNPTWLSTKFFTPAISLSLTSLYLLNRYVYWVDHSGNAEDRLLDYFKLANSEPTVVEEHAQQCVVELANLTGWTASEVKLAFEALPDHVAKSMEQVDWVLRIQNTSKESGLTVAFLLKATDLTLTNTAADWQTVSEAVMATVLR